MPEAYTVIIGILTGGIGVAILTWIRQRGREPIEQDSIQVVSANAAVTAIASSNEALRLDMKALRDEMEALRADHAATRADLAAEKTARRRFEVQFKQAVKQLIFVHEWIEGGMPEPKPTRPSWLDDYYSTHG